MSFFLVHSDGSLRNTNKGALKIVHVWPKTVVRIQGQPASPLMEKTLTESAPVLTYTTAGVKREN